MAHRSPEGKEFEKIVKALSTPLKDEKGFARNWQFAVTYPEDKDKRPMDVFSDTDEASGAP
jgi:hypothetical protein